MRGNDLIGTAAVLCIAAIGPQASAAPPSKSIEHSAAVPEKSPLSSAPVRHAAAPVAEARTTRATAAPTAVTAGDASGTVLHSEGFVPRYIFANILKNTRALNRGVSEGDRGQNQTILNQAKETLGAARRLLKTAGSEPSPLFSRRAIDSQTPLKRETFDANYNEVMPKTPELTEHDLSTSVQSATRAHQALKSFYELNKQIGFNTMDIVARGKPEQAVVRWGHMDNAYYDGKKMVLGGGNPKGLFKDLTLAPDVTYHEVGHAMTEHVLTKGNDAAKASVDYRVGQGLLSPAQGRVLLKDTLAGQAAREMRSRTGWVVGSHLGGSENLLEYNGQSGALNESLSDIYGVMGLHYGSKAKLGALTEKDWLIGRDALNDSVQNDPGHPVALRNMLHPGTAFDDPRLGKDQQPADIDHIYTGKKDNGGVHINSGIGNRAFAEASMKLAKSMPEATTWETTGKVWMHAMSMLGPNATFQEAADATVQTAKQFFPNNPAVGDAIAFGWSQVKIAGHDTPTPAEPAFPMPSLQPAQAGLSSLR